MKKWLAPSIAMAITAFTPNVLALEKHYVAKPQQSMWQMVANTPLECRLVHPIPNYGDAVFSSYASKKINLDFELKMKRPNGTNSRRKLDLHATSLETGR